MRDPLLSIPRVGSSNLSERAIANHPKCIGAIVVFASSGLGENHPLAVNARGSKRMLVPASGRKSPDKIPDSFSPRPALQEVR